jgi:hypothetical protein
MVNIQLFPLRTSISGCSHSLGGRESLDVNSSRGIQLSVFWVSLVWFIHTQKNLNPEIRLLEKEEETENIGLKVKTRNKKQLEVFLLALTPLHEPLPDRPQPPSHL